MSWIGYIFHKSDAAIADGKGFIYASLTLTQKSRISVVLLYSRVMLIIFFLFYHQKLYRLPFTTRENRTSFICIVFREVHRGSCVLSQVKHAAITNDPGFISASCYTHTERGYSLLFLRYKSTMALLFLHKPHSLTTDGTGFDIHLRYNHIDGAYTDRCVSVEGILYLYLSC